MRLICLVFIVAVASSEKEDCENLVVKTELCLKSALRFDTFVVPKTVQEYSVYRKEYANAIRCLKNYNRCLNGLARQVYGLCISGIVKYGKYLFGKRSNVTEILYSTQCLNRKILKEVHEKTIDFSTRVSYTLNNSTTFDEACCSARMLEAEAIASVNKRSCKFALHEAKSFIQRMINTFIGDAMNLVCSKHANVKMCDENYPSVMATLRAVDVKKNRVDEFIIRPLLRMINKFSK